MLLSCVLVRHRSDPLSEPNDPLNRGVGEEPSEIHTDWCKAARKNKRRNSHAKSHRLSRGSPAKTRLPAGAFLRIFLSDSYIKCRGYVHLEVTMALVFKEPCAFIFPSWNGEPRDRGLRIEKEKPDQTVAYSLK